ncbi:hypothetical protein QFZ79_003890 [Arthrobacter sp. V4I6]|nr:hypothetical protein [Arthrobacter sp. V1I7]MDQ0855779.1 hypothetical protein [Arthrobacter sp. V4I6]
MGTCISTAKRPALRRCGDSDGHGLGIITVAKRLVGRSGTPSGIRKRGRGCCNYGHGTKDSYSGRGTPPQSARTEVTVNIRAGAVSVVVLANCSPHPAAAEQSLDLRTPTGYSLDIHELLPFAANPESLFLVVVLGHVDNLCYALEVGVPRRHGPEQAACRRGGLLLKVRSYLLSGSGCLGSTVGMLPVGVPPRQSESGHFSARSCFVTRSN